MIVNLWRQIRDILGGGDVQSLSTQAGLIMGIKIAAAGTAFAVQIPLARILGAAEYGAYALLISWVLVIAVFMRMGMDAVMVRYVAVYGAQQQYALMRGVMVKALGATGLLCALICVVVFSMPGLRESAMIKAGALLLVPATMGVMLQGALRGLRRVVLPEVTEGLVRPLLMLALFVGGAGAWLGTGATAAATANVVAGMVTVVLLLFWLGWNLPRSLWREHADFSARRDWRALALPMMAMAGLQVVLYRTDIVMLGVMTDTHQAGIYAVAMRMAELAGFGILAVNGIIAPMFAERHASADKEGLAHLLRLSTLLAMGVAAVAAAGLAVLGPWLIGLFGPGFAAAYIPLVVLVAGQVAHAAGAPAAILLTMSGRQGRALAIFAFCAGLNMVLNVSFIGMWGIQGAAAATTFTYAVYSLMMLLAVRSGRRA